MVFIVLVNARCICTMLTSAGTVYHCIPGLSTFLVTVSLIPYDSMLLSILELLYNDT